MVTIQSIDVDVFLMRRQQSAIAGNKDSQPGIQNFGRCFRFVWTFDCIFGFLFYQAQYCHHYVLNVESGLLTSVGGLNCARLGRFFNTRPPVFLGVLVCVKLRAPKHFLGEIG